MGKNVADSTPNCAYQSLGSAAFRPPNQFWNDTDFTPGTAWMRVQYDCGMGKISEMRLRVTSRDSLPTLIAELSVSSTPRSAQNRNSAITTLSMVRIVRRLLRNRLTRTRENRFMSSPRRSVGQHALVEVQHPVGALGGVRIVGHHDDGLLELAVESLEQLQDLL